LRRPARRRTPSAPLCRPAGRTGAPPGGTCRGGVAPQPGRDGLDPAISRLSLTLELGRQEAAMRACDRLRQAAHVQRGQAGCIVWHLTSCGPALPSSPPRAPRRPCGPRWRPPPELRLPRARCCSDSHRRGERRSATVVTTMAAAPPVVATDFWGAGARAGGCRCCRPEGRRAAPPAGCAVTLRQNHVEPHRPSSVRRDCGPGATHLGRRPGPTPCRRRTRWPAALLPGHPVGQPDRLGTHTGGVAPLSAKPLGTPQSAKKKTASGGDLWHQHADRPPGGRPLLAPAAGPREPLSRVRSAGHDLGDAG